VRTVTILRLCLCRLQSHDHYQPDGLQQTVRRMGGGAARVFPSWRLFDTDPALPESVRAGQ